MHVRITNGSINQYPYTIGQMRRDNSNVSFPKDIPALTLQEYGVYSVSVMDEPNYTERTHTLTQNAAPTLVDGAWIIGWTVSEKSADETSSYDAQLATSERAKRDALLAATDYLALSDTTLSGEMTTYRQQLREVPQQSEFPNTISWPTKP
jgi:hypothetical protein